MSTPRIQTAVCIALIALTTAIADPARAQSLDGASLGTTGITLTIPNTVHRTPGRTSVERTRTTYPLTVRVGHAGRGGGISLSCTTGALYEKWVSIHRVNGRPEQNYGVPKGVHVAFNHAPMSLPSEKSREVVIEVASNAAPTSFNLSIFVPRGRCPGSSQEARVPITLVNAP